jgi:hypothetical protein
MLNTIVSEEKSMSDHFDAPGLNSPNMDARVDICDIFAFQSPKDKSRSVFVIDVNPLAPTRADSFASEAVYELKVDTDGDNIADIAYRFTFSPPDRGTQLATVKRVSGGLASGSGDQGDVLFRDIPASSVNNVKIADSGGYRFFAGMRSDPFFFDRDGFINGMRFTGADFFQDKNVFSIVLELPNSELGGNPRLGIWGRVLIPKDENPFFQIERMGHPFVNVAFTQEEDKNTFNRIEPTSDRELFTDKLTELLASHGHTMESARQTALSLLPDILAYDYSRPARYPNGRTLTDDVIDFQLALLTNGAVTTDKAGPHRDLLTEFPYVGAPHPTPRPKTTRPMTTKTS